jgi:ABC-type polysaccharide/polyol phosphate export permease
MSATVVRTPERPAGLLGLGDLARHRELFLTLVERQLRLRAKRAVFGIIWPFCAPLFLFALYRFVFGSVFDVTVEHYGIYLFCGLLPWTFLVQAVHDALQSISFEPDLVRRAPMPYQLLPLARVTAMALPFLGLLAGFVVVVATTDAPFDPLLLPVLVLPVASTLLLVAGLALLLALVDVFNRDLRYVLHNLLTVWFFLVPIVYHPRMTSELVRQVSVLDPVRHIVAGYRAVLYEGAVDQVWGQVATLLGCVAFFLLALAVFRRSSVDLAKDV